MCQRFQSTRPSRASTSSLVYSRLVNDISIHKALAGLDDMPTSRLMVPEYFNPQGPRGPRHRKGPADGAVLHPDFNPQGPRGPRHKIRDFDIMNFLFQSTRPSRASTAVIRPRGYIRQISIHKALAGLDSKTIQQSLHIPLTFYALCPPLLISTSSIHSPSLFSRLFRCFSGANLPGISC